MYAWAQHKVLNLTFDMVDACIVIELDWTAVKYEVSLSKNSSKSNALPGAKTVF